MDDLGRSFGRLLELLESLWAHFGDLLDLFGRSWDHSGDPLVTKVSPGVSQVPVFFDFGSFWDLFFVVLGPHFQTRCPAQRLKKNALSCRNPSTRCPQAGGVPSSRGGRSAAQHNIYMYTCVPSKYSSQQHMSKNLCLCTINGPRE